MTQSGTKHNYYPYLDILRVISCILILGVHVSALNWGDVSVTSSKWHAMNLYDCISILGVPLFFMLSGALFLQKSSDLSLKKLYGRKILRLFVVYHFWLLFYNLLPFLNGELSFNVDNIKYELLDKLLCGAGIYHLWFLPELIILYMISPILKEAFHKKEICQYFLLLFAIFGAFLPMMLQYYFPYRKYVASYYERTSLVMMTGYIGYFVLGHYLHSFEIDLEKKSRRTLLWILVIICCAITILACSIDAVVKNKPSTILNTPFTLLSFLACFGLFALCKYYFRNVKLSPKGLIRRISDLTFGIYLIHPFILKVLQHLGVSTLYPHPIIAVPGLVIVVFVLSALPAWLLRRIPVIRDWLI